MLFMFDAEFFYSTLLAGDVSMSEMYHAERKNVVQIGLRTSKLFSEVKLCCKLSEVRVCLTTLN